jgi:hypothetical protein
LQPGVGHAHYLLGNMIRLTFKLIAGRTNRQLGLDL